LPKIITKGCGISSIIPLGNSYIGASACYNSSMFLVGILSWWYGRGWLGQWHRVNNRWRTTVQFFSIGQLFATLFSPFRQISANNTSDSNPIVALRAVFDQLISRVIGAFAHVYYFCWHSRHYVTGDI